MNEAADAAEQEEAAVALQAAQRGKQARREVAEKREQTQAATKLQAVQRGNVRLWEG